MKLNPQQRLVRDRYQGGEFAHIESFQQICEAGDGLFMFLMNEAWDAEDMLELASMLDTAIRQIQELKQEIPYE